MTITKVNGAKGAKGKNGANPTAGGNGDNATFTQNGTIGADSITLQVNGGDGGVGGNKTGVGPGANGGNGGNASATFNGNIFNAPAATSLSVLATTTGGDGGLGGTGTTPGAQGNGGNASVTMNGNILQPSKTMGTVELNAHAIGGNGTRHGNATATLSGNIIQPVKATTVVLEAFAEVVGDSTTHHGDSSWGTKTATLSGNIVQGNINNVTLIADASISNSTASVNGNILNLNAASTGNVSLFVQGEHISVTNNKFNFGKQEFDFAVSQYAPAYDLSIKGNEFTGTGSNIFVFTDNGVPGPDAMHDTGAIDLMTNAFVFGADSNKITKFGVFTVHGNNIDFTFGGDNNANTFNGGDGKDSLTGLGGNDALDGGTGSDTAFYAGAHTQYIYSFSHVGNLAGTVADTVPGRDGTDTLKNIEFIKFSDGTYDVVNDVFTPTGGGNHAPVANNDSFSTNEDTPLAIAMPGVLSNDTDADANPLTAALVAGPAHGILTLNANGSFTYTPGANFNGTDSFTYRANDGTANSNTATVNITVNPVNDAPVANNDSFSTNEDTPFTIALPGVLGNDTDADGNSLTAALVAGPANGLLTLNPDGSFTYTPNANFNGTDSFTYRANDGTANSNTATVNITVNPVNDAPVANNDIFSTNEDTPFTIALPGVLGNDTDADGNPLTAALVAGPAHGLLSLNPDGSFTYTPDANFHGADSFTYRANDGTANSNTATVNITVNSVNDAPVAVGDSFSADFNTPLTVLAPGLLGNDTDADGDPLTVPVFTNPAHGMLSLNPDGSFTYTPDANYNGPDSFTYRASDGTDLSNVATVNINVMSGQTITGTPGPDNLVGTIGDDTINALGGDDILDGLQGNDTLNGDGGDDTLKASAGNDILNGGANTAVGDTADFSNANAGVTISLSNGGAQGFSTAAGPGTVTLNGIENLTGSGFDDVLTGDGNANTLMGAGGNDTLIGLGGNDIIDGGAGIDVAQFSSQPTAAQVSWNGTAYVVTGPDGTDTITNVEKLDDAGGGSKILLVGGGGYATINDAIAAANAGDTIMVAPGTYNENVVIDKQLTVIGAGPGVIIHGTFKSDNGLLPGDSVADFLETAPGYNGNSGTGILIKADGVVLTNLTVDGFLDGIALGSHAANQLDPLNKGAVNGLTLNNVNLQSSVNGFSKFDGWKLDNLSINGGTFSDDYIGVYLYNDIVGAEDATNTTITGSHFNHLTQKGIYTETLQGNTAFTGLVMTDVGQYGGGLAFGSQGANGAGIDVNLKYHNYNGSSIDISGFDFTDVGASTGLDATGHKNAAAIAIKGRDDGSYAANPATVTGLAVNIHDGVIDGTSTGIRAGEAKDAAGSNVTGPAVTISNVDIDNNLVNIKHDQIDNRTNSPMTINGTAGADVYHSAQALASTGPITFNGLGGNDDFLGGQGNDILDGGANDDTLAGSGGNDLLIGGSGNDIIDGGTGIDVAQFSSQPTAAQVSWNGAAYIVTGPDGTDTVTNVENLDDAGGGSKILLVGGGGYATINAAIAAANAGDTIMIAPGTYTENVVIDKQLTVIGAGPGVIIHGTFSSDNGIAAPTLGTPDPVNHFLQTAPGYSGAAGTGILVSASGVTLTNITVEDYLDAIGTSGAISNLTLNGVTMQHSVNGFAKHDGSSVTGLNVNGGDINDTYIGAYFYNDDPLQKLTSNATNTTFSGTTFEHITQKGIYAETLQGNTTFDGLVMNDVGQYGGGPAFGANGANGAGIDVNLKFNTYAGNLTISDFDFDNVGSSTGVDPNGHFNAAAIAIKGRDDPGHALYGPNPADVSGLNVVIENGTIDGTSTGVRAGEANKPDSAHNVTGPAVTIDNVAINGNLSNAVHDDIDNRTHSTMTINGTAGADVYHSAQTATSTGPITFNGLGGSDDFEGGLGNDVLNGGADDDTLAGSGGNDQINGGSENDTAVFTGLHTQYDYSGVSPAGNGNIIDLVGGRDGTDALTSIENLRFSDGSVNVATGVFTSNGPPNTAPVANNDAYTVDVNTPLVIAPPGVLGNDTDADLNPLTVSFVSMPGHGSLTLNPDGSFTYTPTGNYVGPDSFTYMANDGTANSNPATVNITVSAGQTLTGTAGNDTLAPGNGDDTLIATAGTDTLNGGGNFVFGDTASFVNATSGVSVNLTQAMPIDLTGSGLGMVTLLNIEHLTGSTFNDTLRGNTGNNTLKGGAGNDTLIATKGTDVLDGEGDSDTADFRLATGGVTVTTTGAGLNLTGSGLGTVTLLNIENLTGGDFDDTLTGDAGDNALKGGDGNDTFIATASLTGDTYTGGNGSDTASFINATSGVTVSTAIAAFQNLTSSGLGKVKLVTTENLTGSNFNDTLTGDAGDNVLNGGDGLDTLIGSAGNDTNIGGNGNDTVSFAGGAGPAGVTVDLGNAGVQAIGGGFGNDSFATIENIVGTGFDDVLTGSGGATGSNILWGGAGTDILTGAGGPLDIYNGGTGADTLNGTLAATTDVAQFAGRETQYSIAGVLGTAGVTVTTGPDAPDTLNFVDRAKFLSPTHVSDLDNDGVGDLVLQNTTTGAVSYSLGTGFAAPTTLAFNPGANGKVIGTGQFTPDAAGTAARASGILVQDTVSGDMEVLTTISGTASSVFALSNVVPGQFSGFTAVSTGDFNGDAASDILLQDAAGNTKIAFLNGTVGAAPGTVDAVTMVASPGATWKAVSSGDFNGDGFSDIMFQDNVSGDVQIELMRGSDVLASGTVAPPPTPSLQAIGTGDFNGDGMSDILFRNTANGRAQIWTMSGTTRLGTLPNVAQPAGTTLLGAQDIDGNGFSDLLWQNAATGKVIVTPFDSTGNLANVNLLNTSTSHLVAATGGG